MNSTTTSYTLGLMLQLFQFRQSHQPLLVSMGPGGFLDYFVNAWFSRCCGLLLPRETIGRVPGRDYRCG